MAEANPNINKTRMAKAAKSTELMQMADWPAGANKLAKKIYEN
jgi:hypothetical protein